MPNIIVMIYSLASGVVFLELVSDKGIYRYVAISDNTPDIQSFSFSEERHRPFEPQKFASIAAASFGTLYETNYMKFVC